jgi:hypothetical protein
MPLKVNDFYYLQGKTKWFRPDTPNQWGKWEHVLYPDAKSLDIIRKLQEPTEALEGIKNILKKDDDGYFIRIGRKTKIEPRNGVAIPLRPPEVYDKDGKTPLRDVYVGNGSDITTKINVYTHNLPTNPKKRGRAVRWESTRIDNLIPYEAKRDQNDLGSYKDPSRGLAEQPEQVPGF